MAKAEEVWTQLATRIPKELHRRLKLYCVTHDTSMMDFACFWSRPRRPLQPTRPIVTGGISREAAGLSVLLSTNLAITRARLQEARSAAGQGVKRCRREAPGGSACDRRAFSSESVGSARGMAHEQDVPKSPLRPWLKLFAISRVEEGGFGIGQILMFVARETKRCRPQLALPDRATDRSAHGQANFWMRWLRVSATYTLPLLSVATP
jgi:hypothetical protein